MRNLYHYCRETVCGLGCCGKLAAATTRHRTVWAAAARRRRWHHLLPTIADTGGSTWYIQQVDGEHEAFAYGAALKASGVLSDRSSLFPPPGVLTWQSDIF